jgi:threonyl-tRNA synthetase
VSGLSQSGVSLNESVVLSFILLNFNSYEKLGFGDGFSIRLATRPTSYVGELSLWNRAEELLRSTLQAFGRPWTTVEGDGR